MSRFTSYSNLALMLSGGGARAAYQVGFLRLLAREFSDVVPGILTGVSAGGIIDALLKAGADPNTRNPESETPLMAVARSGKVEAARRLLEAHADINEREEWGGQSALMWAAAQSQAEMVKLLASNGADLNARGVIRQWERKVITEPRPKDMNKGGFTALIYAAREGCVECARHLVAAGADPDLEDRTRQHCTAPQREGTRRS